MKPIRLLLWIAISAVLFSLLGFGAVALKKAVSPDRTDRGLLSSEAAMVSSAAALMRARGLTAESTLANRLLAQGIWRAGTPADPYLKASEKSGDTPYAYTLSSGKHPSAIVLAPRFFTGATPTARAALMIHEMGHYRAYVKTGRSDEYDGYKPEYDTHTQLGLTEEDGLVYFSMLDGVVEYVVPRDHRYQTKHDIQDYLTQTAN